VSPRIATDLNLHIPIKEKPRDERQAREALNRTRIWLNCFNLDRSTGSQYGKPPIISNADYVANHSTEWYKTSQFNIEHFDIHICAYNAELRVMASFMGKIYNDPEQPTGLNKVRWALNNFPRSLLISLSAPRMWISRSSLQLPTMNSKSSATGGSLCWRRQPIRLCREIDSASGFFD